MISIENSKEISWPDIYKLNPQIFSKKEYGDTLLSRSLKEALPLPNFIGCIIDHHPQSISMNNNPQKIVEDLINSCNPEKIKRFKALMSGTNNTLLNHVTEEVRFNLYRKIELSPTSEVRSLENIKHLLISKELLPFFLEKAVNALDIQLLNTILSIDPKILFDQRNNPAVKDCCRSFASQTLLSMEKDLEFVQKLITETKGECLSSLSKNEVVNIFKYKLPLYKFIASQTQIPRSLFSCLSVNDILLKISFVESSRSINWKDIHKLNPDIFKGTNSSGETLFQVAKW